MNALKFCNFLELVLLEIIFMVGILATSLTHLMVECGDIYLKSLFVSPCMLCGHAEAAREQEVQQSCAS